PTCWRVMPSREAERRQPAFVRGAWEREPSPKRMPNTINFRFVACFAGADKGESSDRNSRSVHLRRKVMPTSGVASAAPSAAPAQPALDARLPRSIWRSPLVPAALALTAGILMDRRLSLPVPVSLIAAVFCLMAWFCTRRSPHHGLPLIYL